MAEKERKIKKILFSAIGTSDPVRGMVDGPWIHCCRIIEPDLTVLYLTKEMVQREKDKHMYTRTLELLNEKRKTEGKPEILLAPLELREDIENPAVDQGFAFDYARILRKLHAEYPKAVIYANCSSGTPVMKSALTDVHFLLDFEVKRLQVFSSRRRPDEAEEERVQHSDDPELMWETNFDNDPNTPFENRMREWTQPEEQNCHDMIFTVWEAKSLIRSCEYRTALQLLSPYFSRLTDNTEAAIRGAEKRMELGLTTAADLLGRAHFSESRNLKEEAEKPLRRCAEMILTMQIDQKRGDCAEILRKMTPVLCTLCQLLLEQKGMDFNGCLTADGKISAQRLGEKYPDILLKLDGIFGGTFRDGYPAVANLIPMMEALGTPCVEKANRLNRVVAARNDAAHNLPEITDSDIRNITRVLNWGKVTDPGYDSAELVSMLKSMMAALDSRYAGNEFWESYDRMNEYLISMLEFKE